jgi:ABC-type transport system involved in cytochrome bd biosynthesis fused ATPase/permease subunit
MTKKKLKAITVLTIAAIILLVVLASTGAILIFSFPLLILLGTILVGWALKSAVEWLIKHIDYKKVADKTVEHSKKVAEKIRFKEGKKIIIESIDELRNKK